MDYNTCVARALLLVRSIDAHVSLHDLMDERIPQRSKRKPATCPINPSPTPFLSLQAAARRRTLPLSLLPRLLQ
jgi:hypothetical protein